MAQVFAYQTVWRLAQSKAQESSGTSLPGWHSTESGAREFSTEGTLSPNDVALVHNAFAAFRRGDAIVRSKIPNMPFTQPSLHRVPAPSTESHSGSFGYSSLVKKLDALLL